MRCATCGTENAPDSRFCGGCGAKQPGKTAPTAKILDDASYPPTGQPGPASIPPSSYGHGPATIPPPAMPTPAPGSMVTPYGSIPPTSDPSRHISRPPDVSRHASIAPSQQRPNVSAPDVSRAPAVSASRAVSGDSIALPPSRPIALIAIVLVVDLGLAAAGAVMLAKGLSKSEAKVEDKAPLKTEAPMPAPEAPAAAVVAPPAEAPAVPSVPSASAIASVTATAEPPPTIVAEEKKPASAAADKSTASRRGKEKERTATPTVTTKPAPTETKQDASSSGPVTSPSSTTPQDPYADTTPAPKLTTEQEVNKLAASSKSTFDRCAGASEAHGRIQIAFQVLADGRIANAAAVENSTGNTELGRCLVAAISGWTLSPHSGPAQSFVRPFNYP
ncbi:MAG: hypothetical protein HOV81_27400 [Kofleriaceae bacterium]|nr:hypothetical protein [Kofleriaceae bacterium]